MPGGLKSFISEKSAKICSPFVLKLLINVTSSVVYDNTLYLSSNESAVVTVIILPDNPIFAIALSLPLLVIENPINALSYVGFTSSLIVTVTVL